MTKDNWIKAFVINGLVWKQWYAHDEDENSREWDLFELAYENKWDAVSVSHLPRKILIKMGAKPVRTIDKLKIIDEIL